MKVAEEEAAVAAVAAVEAVVDHRVENYSSVGLPEVSKLHNSKRYSPSMDKWSMR
jgi:hypothetical protein